MQEWEALPLPLSAFSIHAKEPGRLQEAESVASSKPKSLGGSSGMVMDLDHAVDACRIQVSQSPYTSCLVSSCCSTRIPLSWETHIGSGAQCRYHGFSSCVPNSTWGPCKATASCPDYLTYYKKWLIVKPCINEIVTITIVNK